MSHPFIVYDMNPTYKCQIVSIFVTPQSLQKNAVSYRFQIPALLGIVWGFYEGDWFWDKIDLHLGLGFDELQYVFNCLRQCKKSRIGDDQVWVWDGSWKIIPNFNSEFQFLSLRKSYWTNPTDKYWIVSFLSSKFWDKP